MAGIGWRLERLVHQGTLAGATAAYAMGAAVMTMPWVLTTAVLVSLPAVVERGKADFAIGQTVVEVAYAVALLVDGPLQIVMSRHTSDRLYEGRRDAIAAPFFRGLGAAFLICFVTAAAVLFLLGQPAGAAVWGGALSAAVGAQWTALSVGNGLCSPWYVLGAVAAGAGHSFLLAGLLVGVTELGIPGYLFGLVSGQCLALSILLAGILRTLPDRVDESARLLPAFRDYLPLAAAGLAFNASLWVDKLVAWNLVGGESGTVHAHASTVAWFSTIPCLAWIFVEVETVFHRRYRAFYHGLEGGATLPELRRGVLALSGEAARLLRGAVGVQAGVIVALEFAAEHWIRWFGLPGSALLPFRVLLLSAGLQALTLLGLILLYYFDLRRDAFLAALGLLAGIAISTTAAAWLGWPPCTGTLLGCAAGAVMTWIRVDRGIRGTLRHVLLGQPFGAEEAPLAAPSRPD